jgi:hypothetical protein
MMRAFHLKLRIAEFKLRNSERKANADCGCETGGFQRDFFGRNPSIRHKARMRRRQKNAGVQ